MYGFFFSYSIKADFPPVFKYVFNDISGISFSRRISLPGIGWVMPISRDRFAADSESNGERF